MTFKVEGFDAPKLRERLTDLIEQRIFVPDMLIIDGFPFDQPVREALTALKALAIELNVPIWFTGRTHRHETTDAEGFPQAISPQSDLFETILQLKPKASKIEICTLKGQGLPTRETHLSLDPVTMLIQDEAAGQ